jgi:hypothetical protein
MIRARRWLVITKCSGDPLLNVRGNHVSDKPTLVVIHPNSEFRYTSSITTLRTLTTACVVVHGQHLKREPSLPLSTCWHPFTPATANAPPGQPSLRMALSSQCQTCPVGLYHQPALELTRRLNGSTSVKGHTQRNAAINATLLTTFLSCAVQVQ